MLAIESVPDEMAVIVTNVPEVALGLQQFGQIFTVAVAIGAGLLVGNAIVRPKISYKPALFLMVR
jgi:hypothetical protein